MPSIDDSDLPFNERPDLTPYLIHLTKGVGRASALENLEAILTSGVIHGTRKYLIGKRKAACFMDIPFMALKHVCSEDNASRYEPYGVVVTKTTAYTRKARPVLYLSPKERRALGLTEDDRLDELWRVVTLQLSRNKKEWESNWTHEREWRSPDQFKLPAEILAALVKSSTEASRLAEKIAENPAAYKCKPRSIIPLNVVCQGLIY